MESNDLASPLASRGAAAEPDASDLDHLLSALQAYVHGRQAAPTADAGNEQADLLQSVCLTLMVGPPELGVDLSPSPLRDQAHAALHAGETDHIPETRVCRLWLACAAGERGPDAADEFATLAREPLWEPVQMLAYRAMADFGRRVLLADLLPKDGPLSLSQADAWLEASHAVEGDEALVGRIVSASDDVVSPCQAQWTALLKAEAELACRAQPETVESELAGLAILADEHLPRTYAEAETQRIAARATAALARARVAQRCDDRGVLTSTAGQLLPAWEREYLQGLVRWQLNDHEGAIAGLKTALEHGPRQTPVRLALAVLVANSSPEAALDLLEYNEPTREMLVAQAALLARLGRYGEAENALARCLEDAATAEPMRYSWAVGRGQSRRQAYAMLTALAERRGDWNAASKNWQIACASGQPRTRQEARRIFAAHRELQSLPAGQAWRRELVTQQLERGCHEIGTIPMPGQEMFFRAVAVMDTLPERAARDFQTLLQRRAWIEAERRVGGGRIVFAGDALLRLGRPQDAIHAYELAGDLPLPEVQERLAATFVCAEALRQAEPAAISSAADRALSLAPTQPWPQLLAAVGLLIAGDASAASLRLDAAEERGAPQTACRCLRSLCAAASGTPTTVPGEDLAALRLPGQAKAMVDLLCGAGPEASRIETFVHALGKEWLAQCPTDPARIARRLLATWCDDGKWDEVFKFAEELARSGEAWAVELATLARVRHALERAGRGELEAAEEELHEVEADFIHKG